MFGRLIAALLVVSASSTAVAYTGTFTYDTYEGVFEPISLDPVFGTTRPKRDAACVRRCTDTANQCRISVQNSYEQCREGAYDYVNLIIEQTGTIDFALLADELAACDSFGTTDLELCQAELEACTEGC